jgi:Domain of unknown function (DUF4267)
MSQFQSVLPIIAKATSIFFGLVVTVESLGAFTSPRRAAKYFFGLPDDQTPDSPAWAPDKPPKNVWIPTVGARALGWASSVLALAYDGQFRSMGIVLLCGVLIGLADTIVIWRNGVRPIAISHIVGTSLLAATGGYLALTSEAA